MPITRLFFSILVFKQDQPDVGEPSNLRRGPGAIGLALLPEGNIPYAPTLFKTFLRDKGVSESTFKGNNYCIRNFFAWLKSCNPGTVPSLWSAWDVGIVKQFFAALKPVVDPTSLPCYHGALTNARLCMRHNGLKPDNWSDVDAVFKMLTNAAHKARSAVIAERKDFSKQEKNVLQRFWLDVYHSPSRWAWYNGIVKRCQDQEVENSVVEPLTKEEFTEALAHCISLTTVPNCKRAGNLRLIEGQAFVKSLQEAYAKFKADNPDETVDNADRRLNRFNCHAATVDVSQGTKTMRKETFVILRPRDQKALLEFFRYIRPNGPSKPTTTKFFCNSKGDPLGKDVWVYIRKSAEKVGINGVTFNTLRRAIETENALFSHYDPRKGRVTRALGHTAFIARKHYEMQDCRQSVQDANEVEIIWETIGEADEVQVESLDTLLQQVIMPYETTKKRTKQVITVRISWWGGIGMQFEHDGWTGKGTD